MEEISGLFEIHIIVHPQDKALLFAFILDYDGDGIRPRPTCAQTFYGKHPNQPMFTLWLKGNESKIVQEAKQIVKNMENNRIRVRRLKVESTATNKGVPNAAQGDHYFEYHFKVSCSSTKEWNLLAKTIVPFGAHLFFNTFSQTGRMQPVVTIRCYDTTYAESQQQLEDVKSAINAIDGEGLVIHKGVDQEYSVLDTHVELDQGWLFENEPKKIMTKLPNK